MASLPTAELHRRFKDALGDAVVRADADDADVLTLELAAPLPERLRVYLFNATNPPGGRSAASPEHKIQLRVPNQGRADIGNFDWSDDRQALVAGYSEPDDVFVLWDASLHRDFAWSKNAQVKTEAVDTAVATGTLQVRTRRVRLGDEEIIAAPAALLRDALALRYAGAAVAPAPVPPAHPAPPAGGGQPYVPPPRDDPPGAAAPLVFEVDPDVIDRGTTAHKDIQDALADALAARGLVPLSPVGADPRFDVAWKHYGVAFVVEVKSLTDVNEEKQLRLGLGQVLTYAHLLDWPGVQSTRPVLAVERQPAADHWTTLCAEHDVILTWPDAFEEHLFTDLD